MHAASDASIRRFIAPWLVALLVLGFCLRVHGVNDYYYSLDELAHVEISAGATPGEVAKFSEYETHPPYAQLLRHYLMDISNAPWFLRGESVVWGLLTILVYYAVGKQLGGRWAGCIAAYLVAFGYGSILQSQIVRNYSLLALLVGGAFYYYRAWLDSRAPVNLAGYGAAALLALMTHYSAVFALACMGGAGFVLLLRQGGSRRALIVWTAVNAVLALYFAYIYVTQIRHNDYQLMWVPPAGSEYMSFHYRLSLFVAYIPATVSYYLHSSFMNQLSIPCTVIIACAMMWLHAARRALFWEMLLGLVSGALLLATDIYPYAFRLGGRHAMWALPYVILPVSLFLAHLARRAQARLPRASLVGAAVLALVAGVALNPPDLFLRELREYQVDNNQIRQIKAFIDRLSSDDVIVTAGLDVLYLLPDRDNYYRDMARQGAGRWYYTATTGIVPILHTRQYPPAVDGRQISVHEFFVRLDREGVFKGARRIWIFNTALAPMSDTLGPCKGLPATIVRYPEGGLAELPEHTPAAEFIGMPTDAFLRDVVDEKGKYAGCL